jgi:uncharacterized protein (DUF362 family)
MTPPHEQAPSSVVALQRVEGDVRTALRRALDDAEWKRAIPAGATVALKVNLGWDLFIPGSITSPMVAEALILEIRSHVGRIVMVEANQVLENVERAYHESGMAAVCRRQGVEWSNMSRGPTARVELAETRILRSVDVPRVLRESLLVTVPVMKTHAKTGITGALKNQWGCLDEMRHEYHLVLDDALADLNSIVRPALSVMDGTVGLEGNGPKSGRPRIADRILCSTDPVALDTIQAISMGIDPAGVGHLSTCAERGIGTNRRERIEVRGVSPEREPVPFRPARHNAVSLVENVLRKSSAKRLFFNSPVFRLCLLGAKLYYHAWSVARGRRLRRRIREHPVYGPQWSPGWPGLVSGADGAGGGS